METGEAIGRISTGLPEGCSASGIIAFVRKQLPAWRDDPKRSAEDSEDALNAQLCKFLDVTARNKFPMIRFDREERQGNRWHADIGVSPTESVQISATAYTIYDPILIIECKRLPAPSNDREREYVTGGERNSGGIQRFKLGLYAKQDNLAALVGYVQDGNPANWHDKINGWIEDLADGRQADGCQWRREECLDLLEQDFIARSSSCRSCHPRQTGLSDNCIELHHLWICM